MSLSLLLRFYRKSGHAEALNMAELTLKKMANGGMYDQLGGERGTSLTTRVPHAIAAARAMSG